MSRLNICKPLVIVSTSLILIVLFVAPILWGIALLFIMIDAIASAVWSFSAGERDLSDKVILGIARGTIFAGLAWCSYYAWLYYDALNSRHLF